MLIKKKDKCNKDSIYQPVATMIVEQLMRNKQKGMTPF